MRVAQDFPGVNSKGFAKILRGPRLLVMGLVSTIFLASPPSWALGPFDSIQQEPSESAPHDDKAAERARLLKHSERFLKAGFNYKLIRGALQPTECYRSALDLHGCNAALSQIFQFMGFKLRFLMMGEEKASGLGYGKISGLEVPLILEQYLYSSAKAEIGQVRHERDLFKVEVEAIESLIKAKGIEVDPFRKQVRTNDVSSPLISHVAVFDMFVANNLEKLNAGYEGLLAYVAYFSMLRSGDSHANVMLVDDLKDFKVSNSKMQTGVGLQFLLESGLGVGGLIVESVVEGSPAAKAGIQRGDVLAKFNGLDLIDFAGRTNPDNLQKFKNEIPEPQKGDVWNLEFIRPKVPRSAKKFVNLKSLEAAGASEDKVEGARFARKVLVGEFEMKNVTSEILGPRGKFVRIRLSGFESGVVCRAVEDELRARLSGRAGQNVQGIILDLRGNPGGDVDVANCIVGLFSGSLPTTVLVDLSGNASIPKPGFRSPVSNLPMVVLMDSRSASASEMLVQAFYEHRRAWGVGRGTFGKGLVQEGVLHTKKTSPLGLDGVYIFKTEGAFFSPFQGTSGQFRRRLPHFEVANPIKDLESNEKREEDLIAIAPAIEGVQEYQEPRAEQVTAIRTCLVRGDGKAGPNWMNPIGGKQLDPQVYHTAQSAVFWGDLQLRAAVEVLKCHNKLGFGRWQEPTLQSDGSYVFPGEKGSVPPLSRKK